MACYLGCQGVCAKFRWFIWTLSIVAAAVLLAVGLQKTAPELKTLFQCSTKEKSLADSGDCWKAFWANSNVFFILSCIGAGCVLLSLLTCCCFVCASRPGSKRKEQFIQDSGYDTQPQSDQYNYGGGHAGGKGGVASV